MHGLVNRSIQRFIVDSYGAEIWGEICREADLGFDNFEAMLTYDSALTNAVLAAGCRRLKRKRANLLEDMGTSWIQTSSATVDLKAAISSAMASAGVLHPRVFLGRLFIRFATSFSHVWLAPFRSVPLGMY